MAGSLDLHALEIGHPSLHAECLLGPEHEIEFGGDHQRGLIHPRTPDGRPNGLMAVGTIDYVHKWGPIVAMPKVAEVYAQNFYAVLRELDDMGLHEIFIEMPPDRPEWAAVRDRIVRATQLLLQ